MAAAAIAALAADLAVVAGGSGAGRHDRTPNIRPKAEIFADTVAILNAQSLPFSVKSDGTIKLEYEKDITFYLRYHTSGNFDIIGSLGTKTPVDKRPAMIDMICSTNYGIRVGCLIMDESDGEMRYRTNFYAGYLTSDEFKATFKRHHSRATATFFRYLPAIIEVRTTNVGGREAVRKIEAPNYSIAPPEYKTIVPAKRPISAAATPAATPTPAVTPAPQPAAAATPATTPAPPVYQPPLQPQQQQHQYQQQQQNYQPQNQQQQQQQQYQQPPPQYQQQNGNGYVAGAIPAIPLAASPPLPVVAPPPLPNPPPPAQPPRAVLPPAVPSMATLPMHPGAPAPAQPPHHNGGYAMAPQPTPLPNGNPVPQGAYAHAYNPHGYPAHDQYGRPLVLPPQSAHPYGGHHAAAYAPHPYAGAVNHGGNAHAPPQSPRTPTIPLGQPSGPPPQYVTPPPGHVPTHDQWGRPILPPQAQPNGYNVPYTGIPPAAATTGNSNPNPNPTPNNNTPPAAYRPSVGGYPTHDQWGRPLPPQPQAQPQAQAGHYNPNPPPGVAPVPVPMPVPGQPHSYPQYQPPNSMPVAAPGSGRGNHSLPAVPSGGYAAAGAPMPGAPGSTPVPGSAPVAAPGSSNGKPDHVAILAELGGALNLADIEVQWSQPKHYRLGKGGMGEVWAGKWRKHTDVAVKVVSADSIGNRTEQRQLFMREMKINRDLRHHPNVVQFIGVAFDEQADRYLLITELCRYKSLSEVIREPSLRPRLTWPARKRMLREAALGVDYLHSERIVHMDIKPLNFLVTEHLQVKVGDFGLAKQLSVSRIHTSIQGMTPAYAAPEAMFEKVSSSKSDVFSFAVVMYEMMTLREPYTAEDLGPMGWMGLPQLVRDRDMRPPLPANMPIEQRTLLTRAWHRDPNQRPSMAELIAEIDRLPE